MKHVLIKIYLISFTLLVISCKKFVEVDPPTNRLVNENVFTSDASANSAMAGIYSKMMSESSFASGGTNSVTILAGLSADELVDYSMEPERIQFYKNSLAENNTAVNSGLWAPAYNYIYACNSLIKGLNNSSGLSVSLKNQLMGEALFIRAFCHFYLVNLFGSIPLSVTDDYRTNTVAIRSAPEDVYKQIISDLEMAKNALKDDYTFSNDERTRPTKWAAVALLARVYLFTGEWNKALNESSEILDNDLFELVPVQEVFLKNSRETIWNMMPVGGNFNTQEGGNFILSTVPSNVALNEEVLNAFEDGDNRRSNWVDSVVVDLNGTLQAFYFPFKYKESGGTENLEYSIVFRLAELYLIRAEARAQFDDLNGAASDLNSIRARAGLPSLLAADKESLISSIIHERQVELFSEWGHRWFDLRRTGKINDVMNSAATVKGGSWNENWALYPIPEAQLLNDPNMTNAQNAGY